MAPPTGVIQLTLIPAKSGAQTEAIVPLLEGEILVKFEDDGGRQSTDAASVIVDFPDALGHCRSKPDAKIKIHHRSKAQKQMFFTAKS
jgi:hypothetical protein